MSNILFVKIEVRLLLKCGAIISTIYIYIKKKKIKVWAWNWLVSSITSTVFVKFILIPSSFLLITKFGILIFISLWLSK